MSSIDDITLYIFQFLDVPQEYANRLQQKILQAISIKPFVKKHLHSTHTKK